MVDKYTLRNGIPVFIVENHASPVVSIQGWVSRGSIHESNEIAGVSHFLEHAVFKGTRSRKVGEIAKEIESLGGEINAFTSFEETAYYTTLASRYFREGTDIIADLLKNPTFDPEEIRREREVILEEIKRAHDSPTKMVSMNLWQHSFPRTPFGRPVLGFTKTVSKLDHKALRKYFDRNYHAGTISVFIVGDIEKKRAFELAEQYFGGIRRHSSTSPSLQMRLPGQRKAGFVAIARDLKECHIQIGIPTPRISDPMIPAMDLACSAIGQGESGRLYQRLVKEKKLALEVHLGLMATSRCGLAGLSLLTAPENAVAAVQEAWAVLQEADAHGIERSELERVKSSLESDVVSGKETVEGYARRLGYYHIEFGDPEYEGKYLQSILSVDREKAGRGLAALLENSPVISMVHPTEWKVDEKAFLQALTRKERKTSLASVSPRIPLRTQKGPITFVTKEIENLPVISIRMLFPGGSREEDASEQGLGNLLGRVWTSGTKSYSALQFAQKLETLGASLHGFVGRNTCGVSVECLAKHWPEIKPMLSELILAPTFPEAEFATEKDLVLREIMAEKDSPGQLCQMNFLQTLYGNHPYGRPPSGTLESVKRLQVADLQKFYRNFLHRRRVVVSIVGDFAAHPVVEEVEKILLELPTTGQTPKSAIPMGRPSDVQVVTFKKEPLFQSHCLIGFLGATIKDGDRYALKLLSSSLAGQGGRLFLELRDKQSLAYTVAPMVSESPEPGIFGFYIGCSTEKLERSLRGIRVELDKILTSRLPAKELNRAKEYWIGRFELDMQRYASQAMMFGLDEIYELGYDHALRVSEIIKSISAEQIHEAARKYLAPERATLSIVHNAELDPQVIKSIWLGETGRINSPAPSVRARRPKQPSLS